jgi:hypothetical protein
LIFSNSQPSALHRIKRVDLAIAGAGHSAWPGRQEIYRLLKNRFGNKRNIPQDAVFALIWAW